MELIVIFLGGDKEKNIRFRYPGAMHRARWMSKAIYSLKIWMFQNQFPMSPQEKKLVQDVCLFVVGVYKKYWFLSPLPAMAPRNDLEFLQSLEK